MTMIEGLTPRLFRIPVMAGEILAVDDQGERLTVRTEQGPNETAELRLSRAMARLKEPKVGDYLVEYPTGHIDILSAETFALKVLAGEG